MQAQETTDAVVVAQISGLVWQCAWCGLVRNGPHAEGELPAEGRAQMLSGATHGICEVCELQVWRRYYAEKIRRALVELDRY